MRFRTVLGAVLIATSIVASPGTAPPARAAGSAPQSPSDGRVEYVRNPLGLDVAKPRFSWKATDLDRGDGQSAYRIRVAFDEARLNLGQLLWDTGVVASSNSTQVVYSGPTLQARARYVWDVQVTDRSGNVSVRSAPFSFEMGLMSNAAWAGQYITAPLRYARKTFTPTSGRTIARARAYVAGFNALSTVKYPADGPNSFGTYELWLNGAWVNTALFEPNWTDATKRVLYRTYDVTNAILAGTNVVGLMMSRPNVMVQLEITYTDGSRSTVASDSTWKTARSPVTRSDFFSNESVDSRLEVGWQSPTFDDSAWSPASTVTNTSPRIGAMHPPILEGAPVAPVSVTAVSSTSAVYDFGTEYAAMPAITVKGAAGQTVTVTYGEEFNRTTNRVFRMDGQRDTFTLKGGTEQLRLHFSYRSFRYMQIDSAAFPDGAVAAIPVNTSLDSALQFTTSNTLLNRIHEGSRRTLLNNVHGHPEDCPHREKAGWGADANAASLPMMMNFDSAAFYTKWLDDLADAQLPSGAIPSVVGLYSGQKEWLDPAWATVYPLLVWNMYQTYGDVRVVEKHYDNIKRFVQYLTTLAPDYIVQPQWAWGGDWAADRSQSTSPRLFDTAYYFRDMQILGQMASLLGKADDSYDSVKLTVAIADAFNRTFFEPKLHGYTADGAVTLLMQSMPIVFGLVPTGEEQAVANTLVGLVGAAGGRLPAGVIGNQFVPRALGKIGRSDLVSTFFNMTSQPSLGYMLDHGPGTFWEYWNESDEEWYLSKNHPAFTATTMWLYESLAGLTQTDSSVGYQSPIVAPTLDASVSSVNMTKTTPYGPLRTDWTTTASGARFALSMSIPFNVTAIVKLPTVGIANPTVIEGSRVVFRNGSSVAGTAGVSFRSSTPSSVDLVVGSGTYSFTVVPG